ncbi:putative acetylornithine aminotransferase [Trichoderma velutinum]
MGSTQKLDLKLSEKVRSLLRQEAAYIVGGVEPLPIFPERAQGSKIWDVDGKEYLDFIVGFSAANQGHGHPYIMKKVREQYEKIALVNISAHSPQWGPFAEKMCKRFGYDKILAMISGTEAADTACKTARKWGIGVKGIPAEKCLVLATGKSYHGMTSGVWNLQDPSKARTAYGLDSQIHMNINPTTGEPLTYPEIDPMRRCIEEHHQRIAAVVMEPYHGVTRDVHDEGRYARAVYDLCRKYNILFISDEVRSGAGKTGKFFSYMHLGDDCKPDMVTMGKSVTGGVYPQSFVMGKEAVMSLIGSGQTASTFAYTPVAIAAATAAIETIDRENLMERAVVLGDRWASTIRSWNHPHIDWVSQIGADCNIFVKGVRAERLGALLMHKGVAIFPVHPRIRVSIPFTMTDEELDRGLAILKDALNTVDQYGSIEGEFWHQSAPATN